VIIVGEMRWLVIAAVLGYGSVGCVPEPEAPRAAFFGRADVFFANKIGNSFQLRRVTMSIDGQPFASRVDNNDDLASQLEIKLGVATLQAGEHDVSVEAEFQGNGYGVFAYLKGYRFKARLAYRLDVTDARPRRINCTAYEKGGPTTPLEERPQIRCETTTSGE